MPSDRKPRIEPSLHILQHALGLDCHGQGTSYRNHFVTSYGGDDWDLCQAHAEAGRMVRNDRSPLSGGRLLLCRHRDRQAMGAREQPAAASPDSFPAALSRISGLGYRRVIR